VLPQPARPAGDDPISHLLPGATALVIFKPYLPDVAAAAAYARRTQEMKKKND
jgi:hypothetical protein